MILIKGKCVEDRDPECIRIRGRAILLPDCYFEDGTVQTDCITCRLLKR